MMRLRCVLRAWRWCIAIAIALLSLWGHLAPSDAAPPGKTAEANPLVTQPPLVWVKHYGDDSRLYTVGAMAVRVDGGVLVAGTSFPAGEMNSGGDCWILHVSAAGDVLKEIQVQRFGGNEWHSHGFPRVDCICPLTGGTLILVAQSASGESALVFVDAAGQVLRMEPFGRPGTEGEASRCIVAPDGGSILLGRLSGDAVVFKVNESGERLWQKIVDWGGHDRYVDGAFGSDGQLVLVGNTFSSMPDDRTMSAARLEKRSPDGELLTDVSFPGRYGAVCARGSDGYEVVYDKATDFSHDLWKKKVSEDFEVLEDVPIARSTKGGDRVELVCLDDGGYVLGMTADIRTRVSRFDSTGKETWRYVDPTKVLLRHWRFRDVAVSSDALWVLSSVYSETVEKKVNHKVGVAKLAK